MREIITFIIVLRISFTEGV